MRCADIEERLNEWLDERRPLELLRTDPGFAEHLQSCAPCRRLWSGYRALEAAFAQSHSSAARLPARLKPPRPTRGFAVPGGEPVPGWTRPALGLVALGLILALGTIWARTQPPTPQAPAVVAAQSAEHEFQNLPQLGQDALRRLIIEEGPELAVDLVQPVRPLSDATRQGFQMLFSAIRRAAESEHKMPPAKMEQDAGAPKGGSS